MMTPKTCFIRALAAMSLAGSCLDCTGAESSPARSHTTVSIVGEGFCINGEATYKGRVWQGQRIEGLLLNARLVQGIFDDLNTNIVAQWAYPDTGKWDAERNTREFIAAMPAWRRHGLLA